MKHAYIDKYSSINSLIHQLDPRIKVISFFTFILFIIFTNPAAFMSLALYGMFVSVLVLLSKIPPGFILKHSLLGIPSVLMLAIFIPFFKKGEIVTTYSVGALRLAVTRQGLMLFCSVLVKAYLCILATIVLIASTKLCSLLKAIEKLRCPPVFIMVLSFMYRYFFVVVDELMKMKQAKESRSLYGSRWFHTKALANMVGILFLKTYERGERVYLAMCSRGFGGNIKTIDNFQLKTKDFCFLLIMICILAGIRILGN